MPAQLHMLTGAPPWLTTSGRTAVHTYATWHVRAPVRARARGSPRLRFNECTRSGPRPVQDVVRASNPLDAERRQMLHEAEARG